MIYSPISNQMVYNNYPTTANPYQGYSFYSKLLDRAIEIQEHMLRRHSGRVYAIHMIVRYPVEFDSRGDGRIFSTFIADFIKYLNRNTRHGKNLNAHYIWRREQNTSYNPHYHLIIWVNSNHCRSYSRLLLTAQERWMSTIYRETDNRHNALDEMIRPFTDKRKPTELSIRKSIQIADSIGENGSKTYGLILNSIYNQEQMIRCASYVAKVNDSIPLTRYGKEWGASTRLK